MVTNDRVLGGACGNSETKYGKLLLGEGYGLTFRELETTPGFAASIFFSFYDAGITG